MLLHLLLSFKYRLSKQVVSAFFYPIVFKNIGAGLNQEVELVIVIRLGNVGLILCLRMPPPSFW